MQEQLTDYDPRWPMRFEEEARRIRQLLGERVVRIDHVGSTAVPGLPAKPIIDMQVIVRSATHLEPVRRILLAGVYFEATQPIVFFHRPEAWPHTHHVHLRIDGSAEARRLRVFRDWLREHPKDRDAYAALKRGLAREIDLSDLSSRVRYSESKTRFIREIERRAGV